MMKCLRVWFLGLLIVVCCCSACSDQRTSDDEYADGYSAGYADAEFEMQSTSEDEFEDGYDIGYEDGHYEGSEEGWLDNIEAPAAYLEEEAVYYAREQSGWHPEEAWWIIEAYQSGEPLYEDGSLPSEQDYLDAINSLISFYEYFYSEHYN